MNTPEAYFHQLKHQLQQERTAERLQFEDLLKRHSVQYRVQEGYTWFPLRIEDSGTGLGGYPYLVVERTRNLDRPNQFSSGNAVELFTLNDAAEPPILGHIHYVNGSRMKLIFFRDELPDWVNDGKIGVNLIFDDNQYKEMEKALELAEGARNNRLADIRDVLLGLSSPGRMQPAMYSDLALNPSQQDAVALILGTEDVAVVHGPPGTGKTTTLAGAIQELVRTGERILVCCPSNAATDHIALKLSTLGLHVTRIGNISRVDHKTLSLTLESKLMEHEMASQYRDYRKRADEFRRMAGKYKRQFGKEEKMQRDLLYKEARELLREANNLEEFMVGQIISQSQVVCSTLIGSEHRLLKGRTFDVVVIDEAAQALEPACWVAIPKGRRIVFAGDPFQLPPTVKSEPQKNNPLRITLMEKLLPLIPERIQLLNVQYRMHEAIMAFSSAYFYENKLLADASVARHVLEHPQQEFFDIPVHFYDTAGCGLEEKQDAETRSFSNPGEAEILRKILASFEPLPDASDIAVISPYRMQVNLLQELVSSMADVNTIDSFQGQERDWVCISLVRSNEKGEIGFLQDYRRMNVAMTRARKQLLIVGDSATLGKDPFYELILRQCEEKGFYFSAWDWMYD